MTMHFDFPVLTALIVLPLAAAGILLFLHRERTVRLVTLVVGILECLLCVRLFSYAPQGAIFQFEEKASWLPALGMTYHLGLDGLSLYMVLLTALMLPLCVLGSWTYIGKRIKEFHICLLLMTGACIGVFASLDFVLFYVFWEAMLVPMYLLIAVWGGPRRRYASHQVLPLHAGRLHFAVGRDRGLPSCGRVLLHTRVDGEELFLQVSDLGLPGNGLGVRHQGSHVPLPHLAARSPRGSPGCR